MLAKVAEAQFRSSELVVRSETEASKDSCLNKVSGSVFLKACLSRTLSHMCNTRKKSA